MRSSHLLLLNFKSNAYIGEVKAETPDESRNIFYQGVQSAYPIHLE